MLNRLNVRLLADSVPQFDISHFLQGGTFITVVTVGLKILGVLRKLEDRLHEHDMMWQDYCKEHGIILSQFRRGK